jgi:hypothetical protein
VRGLAWVGEKIALVVTPVILTVFYVAVIGIANAVTRVSGADMLHRKGVGNPSYWFPKTSTDTRPLKDRYLSQF